MPYVGQKPADIISTAVDTVTGKFSGEVDAASLDISGNIDVDGTTNLDVVDIDGAVNMATTALVTGVLTTTAATVFNGGFASNANSSFTSSLTHAVNAGVARFNNSSTGQPVAIYLEAIADNGGAGNKGAIYFDAGADGSVANNSLSFNADHQSNVTPDMTITPSEVSIAKGLTLTDGNLVVASGHGIDFSATGNVSGTSSELLNDYEEGTWTPIDGSGASLTFSVLDATYTKIGRLVQCYAQVSYPSTSNTAQAQIGGLPFTNIAGNGANHGAFTVFTNYNANIAWLNTSGGAGTQAHTIAGAAVTNANISAKQFRLVWIYQQN